MNVLVLNCGSSSLKFQLIATDLDLIKNDRDRRLAHGQIERIGGAAIVTFIAEGKATYRSAKPIKDVRAAVELVLRWILSEASKIDEIQALADIQAVGHRVVHGGEKFKESVVITNEVIREI
ncbi:MAG: acetate kinase, partial [Acidobacteria bacterium]|nr:acetate kinase [Acidobacteriota bacterium]